MTEILENLQEKLATIPALKYVDEDWGQLDDYSPHPPVKWPCCLIDEQNGQFTDIGRQRGAEPENRQEGTISIVLSVANLKLTNSSHLAPEPQKQKAWLIKSILNDIHKNIHGWTPVAGQGKLMRSMSRRIRRDDGIQLHQVIYTMGVHNV